MEDNDVTDTQNTTETPDFSAVLPETYKTDEGWNVDGFKADYDELVSFKAQADERVSGVPEDASAYEFTLPEGHVFPEGFDPKVFNTTDDDGNEVEFDPNTLFDKDDPDLKAVQAIIHAIDKGDKPPAEAIKDLAGLMINRELSGLQKTDADYQAEMKALGPEGKSRLNAVERAVKGKMKEAQASALLKSITSADGLRAVEALVAGSRQTTPVPPAGGKSMSDMSADEKIMSGLTARSSRK